jgi:hypothetical protein
VIASQSTPPKTSAPVRPSVLDDGPLRRPDHGAEEQDDRELLLPMAPKPPRVGEGEAHEGQGDRDPEPQQQVPLVALRHDHLRQQGKEGPRDGPEHVGDPDVRQIVPQVALLEDALQLGVDETQRDGAKPRRMNPEAAQVCRGARVLRLGRGVPAVLHCPAHPPTRRIPSGGSRPALVDEQSVMGGPDGR